MAIRSTVLFVVPALALVFLGFLSPTSAAGDPIDVPAWEFGDACADVLVFGARGSGQEDGEGGFEDGSPTLGLGPEVHGFARHLAGILAAEGTTVAATPVDYPAVPTENAIFGEPDYFESVDAGKVNVRVMLAAVAGQCGQSTRVVAAGYSQGAAVVRRGVAFAREEDRSLVAALVSLADPNYDAGAGGHHLGGAGAERGGLLGPYPAADWIRDRTVHVCLQNDAFCQSELSSTGFLVHGSGYRDPALQEIAALRVAPLVRSDPGTTCWGAQATIVGTDGNDALFGTDGDDIVIGGGGDDKIRTGSGDDLICPGPADGDPVDEGFDEVHAEAGEDVVVSSEGPAKIGGGGDDDYLEGGVGVDEIAGEDGDDYLDGGEGDDTLQAGSGDDFLDAGPGRDILEAATDDATGEGVPGDGLIGHGDYYEADEGDDLLKGGPGEEYLDGEEGEDELLAGGGEDYLDGGEDGDFLLGGTGLDFFDGGEGDDELDGVDREADMHFECGSGEDGVVADAGKDDGVVRSECEQMNERALSDTNGDGLVRVAVLGDSYLAGVGAVDPGEPYDVGTDTPGNRCRRTSHSWGPKIAGLLGATGNDLLFAACNGATSADVTSKGQEAHSDHGVHGSLPQATALRDWGEIVPADIVLLGVGGNDVDFAGVVTACLMDNCLWFGRGNRLQSLAFQERYRLADTYRSVIAAAREGNPDAELWVATYPNALAGEVCAGVGYLPGVGRVGGFGIDVAEQVFLRDSFLATLNESIAWAATAAGADLLDLEDLAAGHDLCSEEPYFNGVSLGFQGDKPWIASSRTAHPNKTGHARFAESLWGSYGMDFGSGTPDPVGGSGQLPVLTGSLKLGPDPISLQDTAPPEVLFRPGNQVHLKVTGAPPGSYRLVVRSLPTVIAEVIVPASGEVEASFEVPAWLAPHSHWLTLENGIGEPILSTILQVAAAPGCELSAGDSDADGDDLPDRCDGEPEDGPEADVDADGVDNIDDNCPLVTNSGQADVDADDLGDACDPSQGGDPTAGYRPFEKQPEPEPESKPEPDPDASPAQQPPSLPAAPAVPSAAVSAPGLSPAPKRAKCKRPKKKQRVSAKGRSRDRQGQRKPSRCSKRKHKRHSAR